eukprot:scaffold14.g1142.t1
MFSFGGSTPAAFGAASAPAFGAQGATSAATPAFGGFGAVASSAPAASSDAPSFTGFGANPASMPSFVSASSAAPGSAFAFGRLSFSFGGAPASSAAASGAALFPAASSAAASAATAAVPASTPSFSFGGAATPAAGAAASAPAANTQAATSAPAAAAATAAASSAATAPAAVSALQAPSEIQGKPVDDIINEWSAELERRSQSFARHAEALAEWDRRILRNRHTLLELEEELRKARAAGEGGLLWGVWGAEVAVGEVERRLGMGVLKGQESLERKLQVLEMHQKGIHEALGGMEAEAERLYREEVPLLDDESRERDCLYERASRVAASLSYLSDQLKAAIADVNDSTATSLGDASTPMGKVVRILNNQLHALAQIDARTEELSAALNQQQK